MRDQVANESKLAWSFDRKSILAKTSTCKSYFPLLLWSTSACSCKWIQVPSSQVVNFIVLFHTFHVSLRGKSTFCFFYECIPIKLKGQDNLYSLKKKTQKTWCIYLLQVYRCLYHVFIQKNPLHILDIWLIPGDGCRNVEAHIYSTLLSNLNEIKWGRSYFLFFSPFCQCLKWGHDQKWALLQKWSYH